MNNILRSPILTNVPHVASPMVPYDGFKDGGFDIMNVEVDVLQNLWLSRITVREIPSIQVEFFWRNGFQYEEGPPSGVGY